MNPHALAAIGQEQSVAFDQSRRKDRMPYQSVTSHACTALNPELHALSTEGLLAAAWTAALSGP